MHARSQRKGHDVHGHRKDDRFLSTRRRTSLACEPSRSDGALSSRDRHVTRTRRIQGNIGCRARSVEGEKGYASKRRDRIRRGQDRRSLMRPGRKGSHVSEARGFEREDAWMKRGGHARLLTWKGKPFATFCFIEISALNPTEDVSTLHGRKRDGSPIVSAETQIFTPKRAFNLSKSMVPSPTRSAVFTS